jgi:hypothetical protein
VLSDAEGEIRDLVVQYVPEAASIAGEAYRDFLRQLPADRTVHVLCPDAAAFDDFREKVGAVGCRLDPVFAGMYMMLVGNRAALVGEPVPGPIPGAEAPDPEPFDAVASRLEEEGYRVERIPVVPGGDGRTWFTSVNVIIDEEGGRKVVYMPTYAEAPELCDRAEKVWRGLGFEVRRVDCSRTYRSFGSLRCLVSVLRRS